MPVKYAKSKAPLIGNKEFAEFLVKEFGMREGRARETAFLYHQEKKEMILLLTEWIPRASFESIDGLLAIKSHDAISRNLRILEEHRIEPSVWLLGSASKNLEENIKTLEENKIQSRVLLAAHPAYLKANIQALKDRGRNPAEYARAGRLNEEPKYFKGFLDKFEGDLVKELKKKMPKVPIENIEALVNRAQLHMLRVKLRALERREIDLSGFTDTKEFEEIIRPPLSRLKIPAAAKKEKDGVHSGIEMREVIFYAISDEKQFRYMARGLYPNEQEAFKKIADKMRSDGKISKNEMREILKEHTEEYIIKNYPDSLDRRLYKILNNFEDGDCLKRWKEIVEIKKQAAVKQQ